MVVWVGVGGTLGCVVDRGLMCEAVGCRDELSVVRPKGNVEEGPSGQSRSVIFLALGGMGGVTRSG